MKTNRNKSLFWYGFFAKVKKAFGLFLISISLMIGLMSLAMNNYGWIIGLIIFILGIILICKGSSQRFDYQRQSGYIVHSGD